MTLLSENLLFLRESLNLNQSEFGKLFELSRDNIASYERGIEPKVYNLLKIVNYFHITLEQILTQDISQIMGSKMGAKVGANSLYTDEDTISMLAKKGDSHTERLLTEKEKRIEALNSVINAQKDTIEALKKTISALEGDGGHKKRAS